MRQLALAPLIAVTLLLAACGSDDDADSVSGSTPADEPAPDTTADTSDETDAPDPDTAAPDDDSDMASGDSDDDTDTAPDDTAAEAPAEDSGTVTVDGTTVTVVGADFLICETVNPAFADDINIIVAPPGLPEIEVVGVLPGDVEGAFGDFPDQVRVQPIDVARDGRTVWGSFDAEGTSIEFSFTC